jgi:hypothetical protein
MRLFQLQKITQGQTESAPLLAGRRAEEYRSSLVVGAP